MGWQHCITSVFALFVTHTKEKEKIAPISLACQNRRGFVPPEARRPGRTGKELALRDMRSNLITSVSAIESCLHMNHVGQPRPEGILLSSASFFHTEGDGQSRDSFQPKTQDFSRRCHMFCTLHHTVRMGTACEGTRTMTVQLSYQNVLLFPPTLPSKIQSSGVAIQTFANWLTQQM